MQISEWAGPIAHWAALLNGSDHSSRDIQQLMD